MGIVIRVAVAYALVVIAVRVLGKRTLSDMSPLEVVTLMFIPTLFSRALPGQDYSMTNAIIGSATLLALVFVVSAVAYLSPHGGHVLKGTSTVLVENGEFVLDQLECERVSPADVYGAIHQAGLDDVKQVRWAILEANGKISVIPGKPRGNQDAGPFT